MGKLYTIFILLLLTIGLNAQVVVKVKRYLIDPDTNYVAKYPHRLIINPIFYARSNNLVLSDIDNNGRKIVYSPNSFTKMGIVGVIKGLRMGISFKLPSYLNNKGNTETLSLNVGLQTRFLNWGINAFFLRYKGYYLANPSDLDTESYSMKDYPFRSDLITTNLGVSTHVVFPRGFR